MNSDAFQTLASQVESGDAAAAVEQLISLLRAEGRFHQLFDALLLKRRLELGLPLSRPASLRDVPESLREEFERFYVDTAREVGTLLVEAGQIAQAWHYFRAINEPAPVSAAIEALPDQGPVAEEIIEIALVHGVNPVKGLALFLASHGMCSTITALDQQFLQLSPEVRSRCAQLLVRQLYSDLRGNVQHDVERRQPGVAPGLSLRELVSSRERLLADDNYHIDVSHLNSVVRFARALEPACPELDLALQLAEYGSRLSRQYQYAGHPPFADFYPAHIHYFHALAGPDSEQALDYFRAQVKGDPAETDTQLAAYALVDLLLRTGRIDEALELGCRTLADSAEEFGLSLPDLCAKAGRYDLLLDLARGRDDLVTYTAALIGARREVALPAVETAPSR